jgi:hypothetical protein
MKSIVEAASLNNLTIDQKQHIGVYIILKFEDKLHLEVIHIEKMHVYNIHINFYLNQILSKLLCDWLIESILRYI